MQTTISEPTESLLSQVDRISWEFFGSLTFRGKRPPRVKVCYEHAWRFFQEWAEREQLEYRRLIICLREERGEISDRFHFHFLLAGTGSRNLRTSCFRAMNAWKRQNGGNARVRPYDDTRAGVGYVLKCLSGRDDYETRKFIQADQVTLSRSFYAVLRSLDRIKRDTQRAHAKKIERC